MQLNITTDYAIRIILALANRDGEVVSSKDISMTMKIPQKYVLKITRSLVAAVDNCSIRKFYTNFQNIIEEKFSEITIKTLIDNK
mgnify:CR=1 FL=1|jgi:DNA-binding IscR family transcriptional regulator